MKAKDQHLAQELARTIAKFWRVGRQKGSFRGLKQNEFMLLFNLKNLKDPDSRGIRVSELSSKLQITSAAVTQVINSLEDKGFVERLADPKDRRVVLIELTTQGEDLVKLAYKDHVEYLSGLIGFLGEQDSKELIRLLSLALTYAKEKRKEKEEKESEEKN